MKRTQNSSARQECAEPKKEALHPMSEKINSYQVGGNHYKSMNIEPWDVIDCWPLEQRIGYYRGNAIKYLMRMGTKDEPTQEAKKAKHYIEKLIETLNVSRLPVRP